MLTLSLLPAKPPNVILLALQHIDPQKISRGISKHAATFLIKDIPTKQNAKRFEKNGIPKQYMLYVGAIMERKNVLNIVKAYETNSRQNQYSLLIVGEWKKITTQTNCCVYRKEAFARPDYHFVPLLATTYCLLCINALKCFLYPSQYEGFGISNS
jgi:glycosyltransferase involved in cell wall biosynthesis